MDSFLSSLIEKVDVALRGMVFAEPSSEKKLQLVNSYLPMINLLADAISKIMEPTFGSICDDGKEHTE